MPLSHDFLTLFKLLINPCLDVIAFAGLGRVHKPANDGTNGHFGHSLLVFQAQVFLDNRAYLRVFLLCRKLWVVAQRVYSLREETYHSQKLACLSGVPYLVPYLSPKLL